MPSLNVTRAADTGYYLVARGTSLADAPGGFGPIPGTLYWDQTNVNATAPCFSTSSGGRWNRPEILNFFVTVTAVPEPTAGMLAIAGLACGGYLVTWRRKRA